MNSTEISISLAYLKNGAYTFNILLNVRTADCLGIQK